MGSRSKSEDTAYIAGFLDGDGSVMLQVKARGDTTRGVRFMATICFYQDTRHEQPLSWIRTRLGVGYISRRNDGMTELRINGFRRVRETLSVLQPFIRFKARQVRALIRACVILEQHSISMLSTRELRRLVKLVSRIRSENYASRSTLSERELYRRLGLTP